MTTAVLAPDLFPTLVNQTGTAPAVGFKVFTYIAGTSTKQATYLSSVISVPNQNTNPIICASDGSYVMWMDPTLVYKVVFAPANDTDPPSSPIKTVDNIYPDLNASSPASLIIGLFYPVLTKEGATVVSTQYPYGDLRRYGADPTGVAASDTALLNAHASNSDVFDGYPGGGTYLFNTGVTLTNFPLTIRGQAKNNKDVSGLNGTIFSLSSAAGAGGAVLNISYIDGLRLQNIGFQFQTGGNSQFGIHVKTISATAGQLRSSIIEGCAFVGTGSNDTNIGIKIESGTGGSQYSAFNVFRDCYFTALADGMFFTGNATPNLIVGCTFLGYSGAGSTKSGAGIEFDSPAAELKAVGNYFEGWTTGISANGGANIQSIGNDFQVCTQGYNFVAPVSGISNCQSIGDTGVAGISSGYANLDLSGINIVGRLGWLATGGAIQSTRGFQEGTGAGSNLRTALLGYGTTAAVVMTANGGASISAQTTTTWSFSYVGGTLYLSFSISATLTGAGATALQVPIPGGLFPIVNVQNTCEILNNGVNVIGLAFAATSAATLNFGLLAGGAFTAGAVSAAGQIAIRILS